MISFFRKHVWILVVIFMIMLFPFSLSSQSEFNIRILITALAIDKEDDEYNLTAQVIIPGDGGQGTEKIEMVESKAKSISEGVQKLAIKLGKTIGIAHLDYVIIGESMLGVEDIGAELDFVTRNNIISNSIPFFCAEGKAGDVLKKTKNMPVSSAISLQKIFIFKQNMANGIMTSLYEFINESLNKSQTSISSGIEIETSEDKKKEGESSSGDSSSSGGMISSSSSSSESSSGDKEIPKIRDDNDIYIFKDKKFVKKLTEFDDKLGMYLVNKKSKELVLTVTDINEDIYKDAKVAIKLREKKVKIVPSFENGKPVATIKFSFENNSIYEITSKDHGDQFYSSSKLYLDKPITDAIENKIQECVLSAFENTKDVADIYLFENIFYARKTKEYKEYKKIHPDNFAKDVEIRFDIKVKKRV